MKLSLLPYYLTFLFRDALALFDFAVVEPSFASGGEIMSLAARVAALRPATAGLVPEAV